MGDLEQEFEAFRLRYASKTAEFKVKLDLLMEEYKKQGEIGKKFGEYEANIRQLLKQTSQLFKDRRALEDRMIKEFTCSSMLKKKIDHLEEENTYQRDDIEKLARDVKQLKAAKIDLAKKVKQLETFGGLRRGEWAKLIVLMISAILAAYGIPTVAP